MGSAAVKVGQIVSYRISLGDTITANEKEVRGRGNPPQRGHQYPMMVTRVWEDDLVNGQVFVDGDYVLWRTSVKRGDEEGQFE